jgi:hypothetical protein
VSGVPSWARKGAKVVCIGGWEHRGGYGDEVLPEVGETYTIRTVEFSLDGDVCLRLEEIVNARRSYSTGLDECQFYVGRFRPLVTLEDDVKTHFAQYLKTDHRATEKERA